MITPKRVLLHRTSINDTHLAMSTKEPTLSPHITDLKAQANQMFKTGNFEKAYKLFTTAIAQETRSPALFSNRSATAIKLKKFTQALKDAEKAVKVGANYLILDQSTD